MVGPITPAHPHGGPHAEHLKVPVEKAVGDLSSLLTDLQGLDQMGTLPPAVEGLVTLVGQLTTLLGTKDTADLAKISGIIPALRKTMASLEPLVHQIQEEKKKNGTIDFANGPFSTAWSNTLLTKATGEVTDLIQAIS
jgi:hypothetical protein